MSRVRYVTSSVLALLLLVALIIVSWLPCLANAPPSKPPMVFAQTEPPAPEGAPNLPIHFAVLTNFFFETGEFNAIRAVDYVPGGLNPLNMMNYSFPWALNPNDKPARPTKPFP